MSKIDKGGKNAFPIDLKHFKKTGSDKNTTTLQHKDGHKFVIAHESLSPKMRGQLAEMPSRAISNKKAAPQMMAEGGEAMPQPTADDVQNAINSPPPQSSAPVTINIGTSAAGAATPAMTPSIQGGQPYGTPEGSVIGGPDPKSVPYGTQMAGAASPPPTNIIPEAPTASPEASEAPQATPPAQAPQEPAKGPAPASEGIAAKPPGVNDPTGSNSYLANLSKGVMEQKAGIQGAAQAEAATARNQAVLLQKQVDAQKAQQADYQLRYQQLDDERKNFMQDITNKHIDPNRYLGNQSTGQKIFSAIGLILGGIGGGLTHQENPAQKFINAQIDRDIAAQRADLDNKHTLLSANMKQFNTLRDATDMTRVQMAEITKNQLLMEAAKTGDQAAKARALQAAGQLDAQYAPVMGQIAMRQSLLSGVTNGSLQPSQYLRMVVPEGEKAGVAKEITEAQNAAQLRDNVLSAFDQIAQLNTVGNRLGSPLDSSRKIDALRGAALDKLTKDVSGRVTPETVKLIAGLFPQAGSGKSVTPVQRAELNKLLTQGMHFPLAEQYMPRDLLIRGAYNPQGQSKIQEMPPVLPSK